MLRDDRHCLCSVWFITHWQINFPLGTITQIIPIFEASSRCYCQCCIGTPHAVFSRGNVHGARRSAEGNHSNPVFLCAHLRWIQFDIGSQNCLHISSLCMVFFFSLKKESWHHNSRCYFFDHGIDRLRNMAHSAPLHSYWLEQTRGSAFWHCHNFWSVCILLGVKYSMKPWQSLCCWCKFRVSKNVLSFYSRVSGNWCLIKTTHVGSRRFPNFLRHRWSIISNTAFCYVDSFPSQYG